MRLWLARERTATPDLACATAFFVSTFSSFLLARLRCAADAPADVSAQTAAALFFNATFRRRHVPVSLGTTTGLRFGGACKSSVTARWLEPEPEGDTHAKDGGGGAERLPILLSSMTM